MIHLPGSRPRRDPRHGLQPIPSALLLHAARYKVAHYGYRVFGAACPSCGVVARWFDTYIGQPVFACENDACPAYADPARQGYFGLDEVNHAD